jgi:hypothetical protein
MYLFHIFRSFLPLHNPIGFSAMDFVELAFATCLAIVLLARPVVLELTGRLWTKPAMVVTMLGALPIVLRLALLAQSPVPTPSGSDDFSYLLLGDTFAHFRLSNPTHPFYRFFEANFVLQQPSYSSIYPPGQGLLLAVGQRVFGLPWVGVVLSMGVLCGLSYWMLRGWTMERWALLGGLLAVMEFGPLCQWMNCYWGGALSAIAGCLVFGALPRLRCSWRKRDASLLGLGIGLELLTRPFECTLLVIAALAFFALFVRVRPSWRRAATVGAIGALAFLPAPVLMLFQNKAVTGNWTTLPYMVSRYEYGVPTTFTFQPNPVPHRELTAEQRRDYEAQAAIHGDGKDNLLAFVKRLGFRIRYYRFFFLPPLYFVLPLFVFHPEPRKVVYLAFAIAVFALGTNFYPYFYAHYVAALTSVFLLVSVMGLERLSKFAHNRVRIGEAASTIILIFCAGHFLFWYALHSIPSDDISDVFDYETGAYINSDDPEGRIEVNSELYQKAGQQLVFVRYAPDHGFHEWIHNSASIDSARIVWAADRGDADNLQLIRYFHDRKAWLLEPDADPPRLTPYQPEQGGFEDVH